MIRINLLPKSERPSVWPKLEYVLLAVGITAVLILLILAAFNYYQLKGFETKLEQLEEQKLLLNRAAADMVVAAQKRRAIKSRADLLVKLTEERVSLYSVLSHISDIVPSGVWLTEISVKTKAGKDGAAGDTVVTLKGKTLTYSDIADFIQKIEQDERMSNPLLIRAEKVDSFGSSQFEISVEIKTNDKK